MSVQGSDCFMLLPLAFGVLAIEFFGYCLLAIYLTEVLPDVNGVRANPAFFLRPSFWRPKKYRTRDINRRQLPGAPAPQAPDSDVQDEVDEMQQRLHTGATSLSTDDSDRAIELYGLQRRFAGLFGRNTW